MKSETSISRELAARILSAVGQAGDIDPVADWYVRTTDSGAEELWRGGDDSATATNRTSTSWLGSWWPR